MKRYSAAIRRHLGLGALAYLVVASIQIPAVVIGIHQSTGILWPFCVLIGAMFGSTPIFGTVLGIEGAEAGWGWSPGESYLLFIGVPLFFFGLGVLIGIAKTLALGERIKT